MSCAFGVNRQCGVKIPSFPTFTGLEKVGKTALAGFRGIFRDTTRKKQEPRDRDSCPCLSVEQFLMELLSCRPPLLFQDDVDQGVHITDINRSVAREVGQCFDHGVVVEFQDDVDADVHVGDVHNSVAVEVAENMWFLEVDRHSHILIRQA